MKFILSIALAFLIGVCVGQRYSGRFEIKDFTLDENGQMVLTDNPISPEKILNILRDCRLSMEKGRSI